MYIYLRFTSRVKDLERVTGPQGSVLEALHSYTAPLSLIGTGLIVRMLSIWLELSVLLMILIISEVLSCTPFLYHDIEGRGLPEAEQVNEIESPAIADTESLYGSSIIVTGSICV